MELVYTRQQLELIRRELMLVYDRADSELGEGRVSWPDIGTWISDGVMKFDEQTLQGFAADRRWELNQHQLEEIAHIEFDKTDNFRKFVVGKSRKMNSELKHFMLDIYLTEAEQYFSRLTFEKLFNVQSVPKAMMLLADYLHEGKDHDSLLNVNQLVGVFYKKGFDKDLQMSIQQIELDEPILYVELIQHIEFRDTQKSQNKVLTYRGWIVIDPDEQVYILLKNTIQPNDNRYMIPISLDEKALKNQPIKEFSFIDNEIHFFQPIDVDRTFLNWVRTNKENHLQFVRQD